MIQDYSLLYTMYNYNNYVIDCDCPVILSSSFKKFSHFPTITFAASTTSSFGGRHPVDSTVTTSREETKGGSLANINLVAIEIN